MATNPALQGKLHRALHPKLYATRNLCMHDLLKLHHRLIVMHSRGGTGSAAPESTPAGFCVFLSDPDPEFKIWEKLDADPGSLFNFGSSRSLCGHFLNKNMGKLRLDRWLFPESEQESDSQIWKIAGPGLKNFGTGTESESEKVTLATSDA